jgi:uncharacterized protein YdcH (DUF465 family)
MSVDIKKLNLDSMISDSAKEVKKYKNAEAVHNALVLISGLGASIKAAEKEQLVVEKELKLLKDKEKSLTSAVKLKESTSAELTERINSLNDQITDAEKVINSNYYEAKKEVDSELHKYKTEIKKEMEALRKSYVSKGHEYDTKLKIKLQKIEDADKALEELQKRIS